MSEFGYLVRNGRWARTAALVFAVLGLMAAPDASAAIHSTHPPVQLDPNVPVPAIAFDQTRYDFGRIVAGQRVEHAFTVTNTGRAILRMEKPHVSCGCTSAYIGQQELKPGESTQIVAIYASDKGFTGAMRKSILVVSNDPIHGKFTLRLAADVLAPDKSTPGTRPMPAPFAPAESAPPPKPANGSPR